LLVSVWFGRLAEISLSFVFLKGHRIEIRQDAVSKV
jgi:hypothetical protein